ncbi:hypothetical protein Tco_0908974 [Tanacetum coccineum]|uniref:Xylulose kinase-1 n=1 Tax=Tanacetum coccineum TaxID=301880 RepID=A0ABQ5CPR1_9ASTR
MSTPKFAETHNLVVFLEKPEESNGFDGIIDFLNASSIKYALTVNPIVYESCIQQLWATAKAKTVNGERQIQALVDKKKVIITEKSMISDLMLGYDKGTECLPNDVIFEQLTLMGYENLTQKLTFFPEYIGEDSAAPSDSYSTPIVTQPSSSKPQKKKSRRKQRKDSGPTEPIPDEATNEEPISTPSCDPPQSGEDRLQLAELMTLCTKLQKHVLDLEEAKIAQANEIANLKKRVKQLEKRRKSRTSGLKRLRKVGSASRKQKIDEHVEAEKDNQEKADMKRHIEIVKDDEVAIDAIPLATKPPVIVKYKTDKDGRI